MNKSVLISLRNGEKFLLFIILSIATSFSHGSSSILFEPRIIDNAPPDYNYVTHMTTGESDQSILDDHPDAPRGGFIRLVFVDSSDVFVYPVMRIEEIVYYDAGCCWRIDKVRLVDFKKVKEAGIPLPRPEFSGIEAVKWINGSSVEFIFGGPHGGRKQCVVSGFRKSKIDFSCL